MSSVDALSRRSWQADRLHIKWQIAGRRHSPAARCLLEDGAGPRLVYRHPETGSLEGGIHVGRDALAECLVGWVHGAGIVVISHGFLLPASNDRDVNGTGIPKRMALSAWQPWVDLLEGIQAHPGCLAGAGWFLPHLRWEALVFCHLALACWGWCHFFPSSSPRVFFFGLRQRYDLCLRNRECNGSSH